jgi:pyruvate kinase
VPTLAEINDIHNTLADGADGLVLASETAVGKFPVLCVNMVMSIIAGFMLPA